LQYDQLQKSLGHFDARSRSATAARSRRPTARITTPSGTNVVMTPERAALVAGARAWIGTPYKLGAMIMGKGCDCATLIVGVLRQQGLMTDEQLTHFSSDWWQHAKSDHYLTGMLRNAERVADVVCRRTLDVDAGNVMLSRVAGSKVFNHGGIITSWPLGVHSIRDGVVEVNFSLDPMWAQRDCVIFDPFGRRNDRQG